MAAKAPRVGRKSYIPLETSLWGRLRRRRRRRGRGKRRKGGDKKTRKLKKRRRRLKRRRKGKKSPSVQPNNHISMDARSQYVLVYVATSLSKTL